MNFPDDYTAGYRWGVLNKVNPLQEDKITTKWKKAPCQVAIVDYGQGK